MINDITAYSNAKDYLAHRGSRQNSYDNQLVKLGELQLNMQLLIAEQLNNIDETLRDLSAKIRAHD